MEKIYSLLVKFNSLQFKYRTFISFFLVLVGVLIIDVLFNSYYSSIVNFLETVHTDKETQKSEKIKSYLIKN